MKPPVLPSLAPLLFLLAITMHGAHAASAAVRHEGLASGDRTDRQPLSGLLEIAASPDAPFTGLGRPEANRPTRPVFSNGGHQSRDAQATSHQLSSEGTLASAAAASTLPAPAPSAAPQVKPAHRRSSAAAAALRLASVVQAYQRAIDRQQSQQSQQSHDSAGAERSATAAEAEASGDAKEREIEVEAEAVAFDADGESGDSSSASQQSQSQSPRRSDMRTKLERSDTDEAVVDQVLIGIFHTILSCCGLRVVWTD